MTVFACICLAIHPNIAAAPDDGWGRRGVCCVCTMVLALVVPELVVAWAARQLIIAGKITESNKSGVYHIYCMTGISDHQL